MSEPPLQVVQVNVSAQRGGAAIAMRAVDHALQSHGIASTVFARDVEAESADFGWPDPFGDIKREAQRRFIWADRTPVSNSEFSLDLFGVGLSGAELLRKADIIHLHWVAGYFSSRTLMELALLGKPVVWTLHDIQPVSGGCHFPAGCERWREGCGDCPQLYRDPFDLSASQSLALRRALEILQPTFVAPSGWMAEVARGSRVGGGFPVHHIPNGVDTEAFRPLDRSAARSRLGFEDRDFVVLLSCQNFRERRKGFDEAIRIYEEFSRNCRKGMADSGRRPRLLLCGELSVELGLRFSPDVVSMGFVGERERLVEIYNAADVLLFTSLEDNLPNVLLEAGACGLPTCAFPVGGVPDIVKDGETGLHLDPCSPERSAAVIQDLACDPDRLRGMSLAARERVVRIFSLDGHATRMAALYRSLVPAAASLAKGAPLPIEGGSVIAGALNSGSVPERSVERPIGSYLAGLSKAAFRRFRRALRRQSTGSRDSVAKQMLRRLAIKLQARLYRFDAYPPRPVAYEVLPDSDFPDAELPRIAIVTPSFNSEAFIGETVRSVLDQRYPALDYVVQDGGSTDRTGEIVAKVGGSFVRWTSEPDRGQADALNRGFRKTDSEIMAWLNADDMLAPGSLRYVGAFFARNPDVDAIFGHRIVVNENGHETARWWSGAWKPDSIEFYDYIPQETLFWRRRLLTRMFPEGVDDRFQFAMDWDLLLRMKDAGARMVRVPHFLGVFRAHKAQKTTQIIDSVGLYEMRALRSRYRTAAEWDAGVASRMIFEAGRSLRSRLEWTVAGWKRRW